MVIVVNARLLLKGKLEGIGRFTCETLKRITEQHPEHDFIFVFDRPYDPEFVFSSNVTPLVIWPPTRHPLLSLFWFECRIPALLKKYNADLFISTDGILSLRSSTRQIAVIHDLNFVHRPKDLPSIAACFYNHFFPKYAAKAVRLATVSEYSRKDISRSFGIPEENIDVVYNGCNNHFTPVSEVEKEAVRAKYSDGHPYFLFVGALHPRKNVEGLLKAYDLFRIKHQEHARLVIAGGKMFKTGTISETLERMKHRDEVIFTGRIPDEELRLLYGGAYALVFVPFFEGFGIPVIEAMSAGVPVICSNTTSLPEVGGEAALYADPEQEMQIADAMYRVSNDENLRKEMTDRGLVQAARFTWEQSANKLWRCIGQVIFSGTDQVP
ncbi:MAG: glycosyltransferase family 4 protein [Bacteroidota bacterium]